VQWLTCIHVGIITITNLNFIKTFIVSVAGHYKRFVEFARIGICTFINIFQ
jgi:hypothetical protein